MTVRFKRKSIRGEIEMALTPLQRLELNKRVDKIFHAPSNAPANGHQPEIAFVTPMSGDMNEICSSLKDAVATLKAHDKMFQNMRSNMVYWHTDKITSKVTPMSFILMGRAFEDVTQDSKNNIMCSDMVDNLESIVDKSQHFEDLCAYLKLYHARCRCILVLMNCTYANLDYSDFRLIPINLFWGLYFSPFRYIYRNKFFSSL